jgi:hypothetical protein
MPSWAARPSASPSPLREMASCVRRRQLERHHRPQRPHSTLEVSDFRKSRRPIFVANQGIFESRFFQSRMPKANSLKMSERPHFLPLQPSIIGKFGTRHAECHDGSVQRLAAKAQSRNALTYHGLVGFVSASVGVGGDPAATYPSVIKYNNGS